MPPSSPTPCDTEWPQNRSKRVRKTLIYCYSQMCFRPFDCKDHSVEVLETCSPRQRRLLGDLGTDWRPGAYFYGPKDQAEVLGYAEPDSALSGVDFPSPSTATYTAVAEVTLTTPDPSARSASTSTVTVTELSPARTVSV